MNREHLDNDVKIVLWQERYADDFARLNFNWITRFFRIEPSDTKILSNPQKEIIDKGGQIFLAVKGDIVVGCCALIHHPDTDGYELAKMAVDPAAQGHRVGTHLGLALIDYAKSIGVGHLYLEANTKLEASVKLYYSLGFKAVPLDSPVYERCDLYMEADI